jgi:SAM-dependent methyltransferase
MNESKLLPAAQRVRYRLAAQLFDRVVAAQSFFETGIQFLIESYGESYVRFVNEHAAFVFHRGPNHDVELTKAVKAYTQCSMDYLYLQYQLETSGEARYQCSSFEEGRREVYDNPEVMKGFYLDGLYLSLVLWPNHYRMLRYYLDQFLPWLPQKGRLLDLPIGPGSYACYGLLEKPGWTGLGVDISASATEYSAQLAQHWGLANRMHIEFGEGHKTLPWEEGSFDAVVTGELLEHLDDPASFLRECVRVTKPGGFLFVTTAIYAASLDHVFMFEDVDSVNRMLSGCGATMWSHLAMPVRPGDPIRPLVPTNYAAILHKPA